MTGLCRLKAAWCAPTRAWDWPSSSKKATATAAPTCTRSWSSWTAARAPTTSSTSPSWGGNKLRVGRSCPASISAYDAFRPRGKLFAPGMGLALGREHGIRPVLFLDGIFGGRYRNRRGDFFGDPVGGSFLNSPDVAGIFQRQPEQVGLAVRPEGQAVGDTSRGLRPARQAVE